DEVTVWLALQKSGTVTLKIHATESGRGSILGTILFTGERQTIALGKNLHIVAVTATPIDNNLLQPDQIYAYDLEISNQNGQINLTQAIQVSNPIIPDRNFSSQNWEATKQQQLDFNTLSYFPHQLPTFTLPPTDLNQLKIVHGSCRKPHGSGRDALSCLDNLIQDGASVAAQRPHQLFLTGDQIYGDDVADPLLWLAQGVNQLLFGWSETLPCEQGKITSDELPPGRRTEFARIEGGLTAMLHGKADKAKSHLFSFGEYAAVYLLSWSPIFVPNNFFVDHSWFKDVKQSKTWKLEIQEIANFFQDLTAVRRALANVPVYTICDDHDISDDWYLNREWCDRVLSKPLGKRIVQNGLLA
ncbi:MAG: PhoD-like phosphatase, partial [Waterburya sp.]